MAEPLLQRIHSEIRARLHEAAPAVDEYARLETALAALDGLAPNGPRGSRRSTSAPVPAPRAPRRSSRQRASSGARAPRGANRAAALGVLEERPGVSVAELAAASGVQRTVLYTLLRTLEQRGEVAKEQLPGGGTGYRLAPPAAADSAAAAPELPADESA